MANQPNLFTSLQAGDLGKRLAFTLGMLVVFRLGAHVPIPGIHASAIQSLFNSGATIFALLNLFSGGSTATLSIFALSIIPYINASIIMQLMTVVIPRLEEWSKEGEEGQRKINNWTRWGALVLGALQSTGVAYYLYNYSVPVYVHHTVGSLLLTALFLTTGTTLLMWIGERITDKGIGNGISLLVFFGIISRLPYGVERLFSYLSAGVLSVPKLVIFLLVALLIVAGVVFVNEGQRNIAIQYPKRMVGRRLYQGQTSHLPMRVNQAGVIPVIFAVSLLILPYTVAQFTHGTTWTLWMERYFAPTSAAYIIVEFLLVVVFTFFYTQVVFKVDDIADNLKKAGGYIMGIRPGKPTAEYLAKVSTRLTWVGAIFLGVVSILPNFVTMGMQVSGLYFGGTSLLIVVGVALDTLKQIQAQMLMRQYQGFMR